MEHRAEDLIQIFNHLFAEREETLLVRGESEPVYLPKSSEQSHHRIVFAHGYFSSGLHEIAHWCVAGRRRRQLEDFGYWYKPDGRSAEEQRQFELVEVKPQAIEWILSTAAGYRFRFSADNLGGEVGDMGPFQEKVMAQVLWYLRYGLRKRTRLLVAGLRAFYNQPELNGAQFDLNQARV